MGDPLATILRPEDEDCQPASCAAHADRPADVICGECGRDLCLACARRRGSGFACEGCVAGGGALVAALKGPLGIVAGLILIGGLLTVGLRSCDDGGLVDEGRRREREVLRWLKKGRRLSVAATRSRGEVASARAERAAAAYRRALEEDPGFPLPLPMLFARAGALRAAGRRDEAAALYGEVAAADRAGRLPSIAWFALGAMAEEDGRLEDAIACYTRTEPRTGGPDVIDLVTRPPDERRRERTVAKLTGTTAMAARAKEAWHAALYRRGCCLEKLGRKEEARGIFQALLDATWSGRWADLAREKLGPGAAPSGSTIPGGGSGLPLPLEFMGGG